MAVGDRLNRGLARIMWKLRFRELIVRDVWESGKERACMPREQGVVTVESIVPVCPVPPNAISVSVGEMRRTYLFQRIAFVVCAVLV